jgi:4-amino-4-deoxy-L-arabinose transferase-like glycosyltransferase
MEASPPNTSAPTDGPSGLTRRATWALFAASTILHLANAFVASRDAYLQNRVGDEAYYAAWAHRIVAGDHGGPFFSSPLYAYWLAALEAMGLGSIPATLAANAVLGAATVVLTWNAARRLAGERAALLAGALVAFARPLLVYEAAPEKTTLVVFLTSAAIATAAWARELPTWRRSAVAGAIAGLAGLSHALVLLVVPAFFLALRAATVGWRRLLREGAPYVAGLLVAVSPATVHNVATGGEFILIASNGGHNLYLGNHAGNTTGLYTSPPFSSPNMHEEERGFRAEAERRAGRRLRPGEVSAYWSGEALREAVAEPALAAKRYLRKLRWAVNQEELADTRTYGFYAHRLPTTRYLPWDFGLPALLGLLGAVSFWRRAWAALPLGFLALYALALGAFFVYGRYRLPLIVPLAILGGALLARARELASGLGLRARLALAAATFSLVLLIFGRVLPNVEESFFPDYYNQGNRFLAAGRVSDALREYELAITVRPGDHPALARVAVEVARMHLARGDRASAARVLLEAMAARPGDASIAAAYRSTVGR